MSTIEKSASVLLALLDDGTKVSEAVLSETLGLTVRLVDCASYAAACRSLNVKPDGGRLLPSPTRRMHDAESKDGVLIEHLACWGDR